MILHHFILKMNTNQVSKDMQLVPVLKENIEKNDS
jgi:hypothetical protein